MPLGMPTIPLGKTKAPSRGAPTRSPLTPTRGGSPLSGGAGVGGFRPPSMPMAPAGGGGFGPANNGYRMQGDVMDSHSRAGGQHTSPPPAPFTPSPEYSNAGAWNQWGEAAPQQMSGFAEGVAAGSVNFLSGGMLDQRATYEQAYTAKYGADAVKLAKQSGMDPATFFALGPEAQRIAAQWGTNLGRAQDIRAGQQTAYDTHQQQVGQTNNLIDQFGELQNMQSSNLANQYTSGTGMATARYDLGMDQLSSGLNIDLGMLGEQRFRAVDLAQQDNAAQLNYLNQMYGITDARRGIRGQQHSDQQNYLNQQAGFLNTAQKTAYDRFNSNDSYMAGQAQDLMAQYGFNTRNYDLDVQDAFAQRSTQQRGAVSDSAARGAFGSAGFRDNISDIRGQYDQSVARSDLGLDAANQQVDEQGRAIGNNRANLRFGYADTTLGFDRDKAGLTDAHNRNNTSYADDLQGFKAQYAGLDRDKAKTMNVDAGLKSLGREYGLKEADINNQFKNATTALKLDYNDTMQQLEQMMASGNANLYAQAMQFMQQMMAYQ